MSELYIIATMVSKPDKADALRALLLPVTAQFKREPGCLAYALLEHQKTPGRFMTFERWADAAAVEAHMSSSAMASVQPRLPELLAEDLKQDFLDARLVL